VYSGCVTTLICQEARTPPIAKKILVCVSRNRPNGCLLNSMLTVVVEIIASSTHHSNEHQLHDVITTRLWIVGRRNTLTAFACPHPKFYVRCASESVLSRQTELIYRPMNSADPTRSTGTPSMVVILWASPKSTSLMSSRRRLCMMTLSGWMLRCTTPRWCRNCTASNTWNTVLQII